MPQVSHHFVADRPIDAMFDLITTARFWTDWHPAPSAARWVPLLSHHLCRA